VEVTPAAIGTVPSLHTAPTAPSQLLTNGRVSTPEADVAFKHRAGKNDKAASRPPPVSRQTSFITLKDDVHRLRRPMPMFLGELESPAEANNEPH